MTIEDPFENGLGTALRERTDSVHADLGALAVDDHAHRMTSASVRPPTTCATVASASAGATRKPWR